MVDLLLAVAAIGLMLDVDVRRATLAYVLFTLATLATIWPHLGGASDLAFFVSIAVVKLVVGPGMLLVLVQRYGARTDMTPSFALPVRALVAFAVVALAHAAASMSAFAPIAHAATVFTALLASAAVVIMNRSLLAHALGLLALGSAIALASATFAPGLPIAVELGDTFDAVLATFVALAIARAAIVHDPALDIRSMRRLRG